MILLIPLGGIGKRFRDNGYDKPKALINVFGKPILYYLLDNINFTSLDYVILPYNKEYKKYNFEDKLKKDYPDIKFKFHCLENNTRGASETINIALNKLAHKESDCPIICLDSDNFYLCDIINKWNGENCVFSHRDTSINPIYSYIKCSHDNSITDIAEKEKISDFACTGGYGFDSVKNLIKYTEQVISEGADKDTDTEFYTSGVIQEMIMDGYKFKNKEISKKYFICLGTPFQLKLFYNNYPRISSLNNVELIKPKRICFDLDNTLVTFPDIPNDYTSVKPIMKNINLLKYLKRLNNTIIIYTARRMKTYHGDIGKINADIGKITFSTLEKYDIPYDEIYFGKPYADFYIDDLAVNCFDNIEKELGYYNNVIEPRDFHSIEHNTIEIITKKGILNGEIYFYKNIPIEIKDLFPLFFGNIGNNLKIEKINGITLTDMYLSELLTESTLEHVLRSMERIHNVNIDKNDNTNIYQNYKNKLIKRYEEYDYSSFENSNLIYNDLLIKLTHYENNDKGIKKVIHGDPVFTNILINNYDKIKFIDMRGKQGDDETIYGDWLYDYAKIYQSLIGYDEILLSKKVNEVYKNRMINFFKNYFIEKYSENDFQNLKTITDSLLFTLIPLHPEDNKLNEYYNLIT